MSEDFTLVCGCSGVGKTTLAKQLAKTTHAIYLSPDDLYAKINGDAKIRKNKFRVWNMLFQEIQKAWEEGEDVVVDTNALTLVDRDQFLGWFPGFKHHLIYVEASDELRLKNNAVRDRQIPEDILLAMSTTVEPPRYSTLNKEWRSFMHIINHDNKFTCVIKEGQYHDAVKRLVH